MEVEEIYHKNGVGERCGFEGGFISIFMFSGRAFQLLGISKYDIGWCIEENWKPLLGYSPETLVLVHGWFFFHFRKAEDVERILERVWLCGSGSLMVKGGHTFLT
jgi:hypothetical protein